MAADLIPFQGELEPDELYDGMAFEGSSFDGADAAFGHFLECLFSGVAFDGGSLRKARFTDTGLREARFVACDWNATQRGARRTEPSSAGLADAPLACPPRFDTLTRTILCDERFQMKTSSLPFVSPLVRFDANEWKAT